MKVEHWRGVLGVIGWEGPRILGFMSFVHNDAFLLMTIRIEN